MANFKMDSNILYHFSPIIEKMRPEWKEVIVLPCTYEQNYPVLRLELMAYTQEEPPRFFRVWKRIPRNELDGMSEEKLIDFLYVNFSALAAALDSFLDAECKCVPGPNGEVGEHCEYHKGIYGH